MTMKQIYLVNSQIFTKDWISPKDKVKGAVNTQTIENLNLSGLNFPKKFTVRRDDA